MLQINFYYYFEDSVIPSLRVYDLFFGCCRRAICERRKDERREVLLAGISKTLSSLTGDALTRVKAWLDESYNKTEEVEAIISAEEAQVFFLWRGVLIMPVQ